MTTFSTTNLTLSQIEAKIAELGLTYSPESKTQSLARQRQHAVDTLRQAGVRIESSMGTKI